MGTKHFIKSFDFEEIEKLKKLHEKQWGFKILKSGLRHVFIIQIEKQIKLD